MSNSLNQNKTFKTRDTLPRENLLEYDGDELALFRQLQFIVVVLYFNTTDLF